MCSGRSFLGWKIPDVGERSLHPRTGKGKSLLNQAEIRPESRGKSFRFKPGGSSHAGNGAIDAGCSRVEKEFAAV
jgi:hypothetical protein